MMTPEQQQHHNHAVQQQQQYSSNTTTETQVVGLTADSLMEKEKTEVMLMELEAKKRAFSIVVPTLPFEVTAALRSLSQPIRLFGEDASDIRQRLRMVLARKSVIEDDSNLVASTETQQQQQQQQQPTTTTTTYTHASIHLIEARRIICQTSLERAKMRLEQERYRRSLRRRLQHKLQPKLLQQLQNEDDHCRSLFRHATQICLEGSQYGDTRPLSAICSFQNYIVTASWNATIKIWGNDDNNTIVQSTKAMAHHDRIMGISSYPMKQTSFQEDDTNSAMAILATSSIDLTAKLWKVVRSSNTTNTTSTNNMNIVEQSTLKGHQSRLCKIAFHPQGGRHVFTTSFDTTWRLWDVETSQELLLQDGHDKETYGIGIHPDGSIISITDFGGIVNLWDLRSGKSVIHFTGHAKRVLCSEFHPNGIHLTTAGDDGTLRVWDLRKRASVAIVPAHSNLITQIRYLTGSCSNTNSMLNNTNDTNNGEVLATCSYDGTCRLWSTRDWSMLHTLQGHEGKVTGVDFITGNSRSSSRRERPNYNNNFTVATCGFDKTLKLWN